MIGPVEDDEPVAAFLPGAGPELRGHAAGTLDRGRTVVGEKDPRQRIARGDLDEFRGEADGGFVGETERGAMARAVELVADRRIDQGWRCPCRFVQIELLPSK